jgi:hypothetical protein
MPRTPRPGARSSTRSKPMRSSRTGTERTPDWARSRGLGSCSRGRQASCAWTSTASSTATRSTPAAARIVERCQSWTEISPSGTGLHIFVRGSLAWAIKGSGIEVYSEGRYMNSSRAFSVPV